MSRRLQLLYYCGMPAIGSSAEVVVSCGVTQWMQLSRFSRSLVRVRVIGLGLGFGFGFGFGFGLGLDLGF
jgi:hypothetical protein